MMNTIKTFALSAVALFALCLSAQADGFLGLFGASAAKTKVTISPNCVTNTYDGVEHTSTKVLWEGEYRNPGDHVAKHKFADYQTDVGKRVSSFATDSVVIENDQGVDVTGSYDITYGEGEIVVLPRAITLTTPSYTNKYNSASQSSNEVVITETNSKKVWNFPANDGAITTNFASIVKAGATTNWVELVFADASKTNNYVFTENFGELVIKKSDAVMRYFDYGEVLYLGRTNDLGVVANVKDSPYPGYTLQGDDWIQYVCAWSTNKNCGTYAAYSDDHHLYSQGFKIVTNGVFNAKGENVTDCYKGIHPQLRASSKLKIVKREVWLTSADAWKYYDGTPLTTNTVKVTGDGWADGEGATYNVTGSQTNVGSSSNDFEYTLNENTSTNNYDITQKLGTLTVLPRRTKGAITSASITKEYDGGAVSTNEVDVTGVTGLMAGDEIVAWCMGSQTAAGICTNEVAYYITNKTMKADVTTNYTEIVTMPGLITVTKRPITVQFFDATYTYDGTDHWPTNAVIEGTLVAGDGIFASWIPYQPVDAGVYACTNTALYVTNASTIWAAMNYDITRANTNALVQITKRPVTLSSASAEKFYDGQPLSTNELKVTAGSIVSGESFECDNFTNLTEVGRIDNTFEIIGGSASTNNYAITYDYGTLTVKAQRMAYDLGGGDFTNSDQVAWSFVQNSTPGEVPPAAWFELAAASNEVYYGSGKFVTNSTIAASPTYTGLTNFMAAVRANESKIIWSNDCNTAGTKPFYGVKWNHYNPKSGYLVLTNLAHAVDFEKECLDRLAAARKAIDDAMWGVDVRFYTPVRTGYKFVGWKNELTGKTYPGDGTEQTLPASLVKNPVIQFKAVWVEITDKPKMTEFFDATDKILEAKSAQYNTRDAKYANLVIDNVTPGVTPELERYSADITLKFPNSINTYELVANVTFCVDGGAAFKPWAEALTKLSWTNAVTKPVHDDTLGCWKVTWRAYVTKGMLSAALTNEVGQAIATTKLYCRWSANAGDKYQAVYTANFDADTVTLQEKGEDVFPQVQAIAWHKGYGKTQSEVNSNEWAAATAIASCDIRTEAITVDDLTRTGYVFKGWVPASTRGAVAQMKDVTLSTWELPVVAQWTTNLYTAVFTNELKYADGFKIKYKDPMVTNVWTVEDLALDLPGIGGVSAKYYDFVNWTNETGKVFGKKIRIEDIGTNKVDTFTFWANMKEHNFKVRYHLKNGFANINKPGTPYRAHSNSIKQYSVSTNDGAVVALNDASCFGCKFVGWTPAASIDPMAGSNMTFTANWEEYQAMVVDGLTTKTNFFTSVAEAVAAVTNSNTTIAFLDAKGDGINNPCQIEIGDNLKGITVNFCALDYTNKVGDAALTIGTNSEVAVTSVPGYIGETTKLAPARLVQQGGGNAVKVGENSTFTLDDSAVTIDVVAGENKTIEKITEEYEKIANWKFQYEDAQWWIGTNTGYVTGFGATNFLAKFVTVSNDVYWTQDYSWEKPYGGVAYLTDRNDEKKFITLTNAQHALTYVGKIAAQAKIKEALYKVAKARYEEVMLENCAAIYAPSNATLVLKKGKIGAKAYGEAKKCASIDWVGHREYLDYTTNNLVFATQPLQQNGIDRGQFAGTESQVAEGCIWTMNTSWLTKDEFPYTITEIGPVTYGESIIEPSVAKAMSVTSPDVVATTTTVRVKGTFVTNKDGDEILRNSRLFLIQNPAGITSTNATVVGTDPISEATMDSAPSVAEFRFGSGYKKTAGFIKMLVGTLEQKAPSNAVVSVDWDGAAGVTNAVTYTAIYDAKDIVISNVVDFTKPQVFPNIARIFYWDAKDLINTDDLRKTYTVLDTTEEGGLALEPAVGNIYTNSSNVAFRFDGWYSDYTYENLVTNLVHTTGAGDDATNVLLTAKYTKLVWGIGTDTRASYADLQSAVDALKDGGTVRFLGETRDACLTAPLNVAGKKGVNYTIDLGGEWFSADGKTFKGDYLVEVAGGDVTLTNGTLGAGLLAIPGPEVLVGGVHAVGADTRVTLANGFKVDTYKTMVCADEGSTVTADGAKLATDYSTSPDAGVKAFAGATLEFKDVSSWKNAEYHNTVFASNATFVATNSSIVLKADVAAITVIAGSKVELCNSAGLIRNNGAGSAIDAEDSAVEISTRGTVTASGMNPVILLKNSSLELNKSGVIKNLLGMGVYSTVNAAGEFGNAAVVLNGGSIEANGVGVQIEAGKLTVPADSKFYGYSKDATVCIENKLGLLTAEDISIEGGTFDVKYGETTTFPVSLKSRNSVDPNAFVSNFLRCAYVEGVKGALFKTAVPQDYCAMGYKCCVDGERVMTKGEAGYEYWYYVDTIPYAIEYDLDGGTRVAGTDVWPTSYDVEDGVIRLPSNTVVKANWFFNGWSISNTVTDVVTTNMTIDCAVTSGDLALKALWTDRQCKVYVDYQGTDGYPKYVRHYNDKAEQYFWTPSKRYANPNYATGTDAGFTVTPAKRLEPLDAPTYKGYEFIRFVDVASGKKYEAGQAYEFDDFDFVGNKVQLRAVWASDIMIVDEEGNKYYTIEDAIASNTVEYATLKLVGGGTVFTNKTTSTIVIDKNITLDLNGKMLALPEGFEGDALVVISNATDAAVVNGGLTGTDEIAPLKVLDKNAAAVKAVDADWELAFTVELGADYIADGYKSAYDEKSELWTVVAVVNNLTFAAGDTSKRPDLTVTLNNEATTFTCESDPIELNDATRDGYDFVGWNDGKQTIKGTFDPAGVTKDVTLTAIWSATKYAITYKTEGGVIEGEKTSYTCEDAAFTLVTPVRPGYTFNGWSVNGAESVLTAVINPQAMSAAELGPITAVATWKANAYTITFDTLGGKNISDLVYNESLAEQGLVSIPAAEKVGCKFVKWIDEYGQERKTGVITSCYSANLTAVYDRSLWTDGNVIGGNTAKPCTTFNGNVTYTGSILDKDSKSVGKVTVTAGKPNAKGLVTITMTTSTILGEGKSYTLKNTTVDVSEGEIKDVELTNTAKDKAVVRISDNGVDGTFGEYKIVASADRFATNVTKIPAATLAYLQGNWTVGFQSKDACHGATTLKLTIAAKGKVTITGNLGDGTAISTSSQLVYGDGVCVCPIVVNAYTGKKGGFACDLWFGTTGVGDNLADECEITSLSDLIDAEGDVLCEAKDVQWAVQRVAENVTRDAYVFKVNLADFDLPEGELLDYSGEVSIEANVQTGKLTVPATTTVSINATTGAVIWKNPDCENKLGLALAYTKSTGALTGSMKVYAKVQNAKTGKWSLKTYTAKVYGVMSMVGEYGLCTATEKTIGSAPAELKSAEID